MKVRRNWTNCSAQWCFSLLRWGDMLPYCAEWKNSRLTLAAGLLFQTTLSTLFQSGYHTHLCWFWTAQTLEKEKHNSLLSQSFAVCLCRFLLHITHMPLHANEKCQEQTTWLLHAWSEENLPVFINEPQCAESHSYITVIRQACAGLTPAPPAPLTHVPLKVIYTKAANFTGAKMCNEENLKHYCAAQMIPG